MARPLANFVLAIPRLQKRMLAVSADAVLCVASVLFAFYLRLDTWVVPTGAQWLSIVASLVFAIPLFVTFGLYRAIFRYAGWSALMAIARAGFIYGLAYATAFTVVGVAGVPRTIGIIQPILLFLAIGASRGVVRFWLGGGYEALLRAHEKRRVMIYGAGSAGRQLASALAQSAEMIVIGFIDDDFTLQGSVLNGKMIYSSEKLPDLFSRLAIDDVLLALPSASRKRRNEIIEVIRGTPVSVRTLPGLMDLAHGRVTTSDIRELDIEDLLGRESVSPNPILMSKNIAGKTVLVTGAGGSIGSELCRQIVGLNPARLLLVEMSEFALYSIHQELTHRMIDSSERRFEIVPLLASVTDAARMNAIVSTWTPQTVYHAAAYKHVPLVEHNPVDGVRNNVFGTLVLAQTAMANGVQDFVLISTDKAVRPTNIMGTTKRLAEMILQALAAKFPSTRFSMVRFGNVLGSSGSVVPLFRKQIRDGGPVTITHEEITRYFMTIPEAAELVIQAGAMSSGGEVFVLDMGSPVKIIDLARNIIELSGFTVRTEAAPDGDIEISVIGLRPGEKLYEELLIGNDPAVTSHSRVMKANEKFIVWERLEKELDSLQASMAAHDPEAVRHVLKSLVPEYSPERDIADWVQVERRSEARRG